ncbi:hypothetical protein DMENIID0001_061770 [Sergentomyia squamirostris]
MSPAHPGLLRTALGELMLLVKYVAEFVALGDDDATEVTAASTQVSGQDAADVSLLGSHGSHKMIVQCGWVRRISHRDIISSASISHWQSRVIHNGDLDPNSRAREERMLNGVIILGNE